MNCLETRHLAHRYGNDTVLDDLGLAVPDGSIYGFLGPNGAGKTTTLRLILGLIKVQQGEISLFGQSLVKNRIGILRNVGSMIETPSLYGNLTAFENLEIAARLHHCSPKRSHEVLELVGLKGIEKKTSDKFSLGMKQRLAIAIALLHKPKLLILDEPSNGLDPNGVIEMRQMLQMLNQDQGITILISSHILAEIEKLVTHIGILSKGKLMYQGSMAELICRQEQTAHVFVRTSNNDAAMAVLQNFTQPIKRDTSGILLASMNDLQTSSTVERLIENDIKVFEVSTQKNDLESFFMRVLEEGK